MRAPFRPKPFLLELGHSARRKGHAIAHSPRPAPCLRRPVGYLALSLPGPKNEAFGPELAFSKTQITH
jgi:hypothetical protein